MKTILANNTLLLDLGKRGENKARRIRFDISAWAKEYGADGTVALLHQRESDAAPYPVALEVKDCAASWVVTLADTAIKGYGHAELQYLVEDIVVKSCEWTTFVENSMAECGETPPEPQIGWVQQVLAAAKSTEDIAEQVEKAAAIQPKIVNGYWCVWDIIAEEYVNTGTKAQGEPGKDGDQNVFIATYNVTTYEELEAAYNAGKAMVLKHETLKAPFLYMEGTSFVFSTNSHANYFNRWCAKDGTWGYKNIKLPTNERVTALEEKVAALEEGGGGEREVFFAHFGATTREELENELGKGRLVICLYGEDTDLNELNMTLVGNDVSIDFFAVARGVQYEASCDTDGNWTMTKTRLATENEIGDIDAALDAIHEYALQLITGGVE